MKKAFIEVPLFFVIIFIAVILMGENFKKSTNKISLINSDKTSNCMDTKNCPFNNLKITENRKEQYSLKSIKSHIRKFVY